MRTRQITMEEATELFSLQQGMIRAAASASGAAAGGSGPRPSPAVGQPTVVGAPTDDLVWLSLLGVGTAAGLLAAMMKRFQEGPRATPSSGAVK